MTQAMERSERDELLRRLVRWQPEHGVLSVYVAVDPGDRSKGWRIALRDRLRELSGTMPPHQPRRAFQAAANAVLGRFPEDGQPPQGRGHVGFVEVAERPREVWRDMQVAPRRTGAVHAPCPYLRPLVEVFDAAPYVGAVVVSSERVRLLEWSLGAIRRLDDWEITLFSLDWRERKAERPMPGAEGTSASGRDQFGQRLEANRERFLHEAGARVASELTARGWRHLIAFGSEEYVPQLRQAMGDGRNRVHAVAHDLISAPDATIADQVAEEVQRLNAERERALVASLEEAIGSPAGAALGPQEVLQSLEQGRVRHLLFDADHEALDAALAETAPGDSGVPGTERMIELAVSTGAEITPLEGEPARALQAHDGAAALLRY